MTKDECGYDWGSFAAAFAIRLRRWLGVCAEEGAIDDRWRSD